MVPTRTLLTPVTGLTSSYKNKKGALLPVEALGVASQVTHSMLGALVELDLAVRGSGGTLLITELWRSWGQQAAARKAKPTLANPPGRSFHQAGAATDLDVKNLNFKGVSKDKQLQKLWDLALPIGFHPVISKPDLSLPECWHLQLYGKDWESASKHISSFELAKAMILDVGCWDPSESTEIVKRMFIQSQLIRLGHYDVGAIDGIIGNKTSAVLRALNLSCTDADASISSLVKL